VDGAAGDGAHAAADASREDEHAGQQRSAIRDPIVSAGKSGRQARGCAAATIERFVGTIRSAVAATATQRVRTASGCAIGGRTAHSAAIRCGISRGSIRYTAVGFARVADDPCITCSVGSCAAAAVSAGLCDSVTGSSCTGAAVAAAGVSAGITGSSCTVAAAGIFASVTGGGCTVAAVGAVPGCVRFCLATGRVHVDAAGRARRSTAVASAPSNADSCGYRGASLASGRSHVRFCIAAQQRDHVNGAGLFRTARVAAAIRSRAVSARSRFVICRGPAVALVVVNRIAVEIGRTAREIARTILEVSRGDETNRTTFEVARSAVEAARTTDGDVDIDGDDGER